MNIRSPFCCLGGRLLLVIAMAFSLTTSASGGLLLQSYSPKKHTRFYGGSDKEFIGADFDSSGVGRVTSGNCWATWQALLSVYIERRIEDCVNKCHREKSYS